MGSFQSESRQQKLNFQITKKLVFLSYLYCVFVNSLRKLHSYANVFRFDRVEVI
jgi:hypothetical protein